MASALMGTNPKNTYRDLLRAYSGGVNQGVSASAVPLLDGAGNSIGGIQVSQNGITFPSGAISIGGVTINAGMIFDPSAVALTGGSISSVTLADPAALTGTWDFSGASVINLGMNVTASAVAFSSTNVHDALVGLQAPVAANGLAITGLQASVAANGLAITGLQSSVAANGLAITGLQSSVAALVAANYAPQNASVGFTQVRAQEGVPIVNLGTGTTAFTLSSTNLGTYTRAGASSAPQTLTIPTGLSNGEFTVVNIASNAVILSPASGVTLTSSSSSTGVTLSGLMAAVTLKGVGSETFDVVGSAS